MPTRAARFCKAPGCACMVIAPAVYCDNHLYIAKERENRYEERRGSSYSRGYDSRWRNYSKSFLRDPKNQFCALHLDDGCNILAECVDHIDPPNGPHDRKFWDRSNHQPACIHCNSVKGHRKIVGTFTFASSAKGVK